MNSSSTNQALQDALALHRQGNLRAAMDRYVQILQNDPRNAEALYYVAVVAMQERQYTEGIKLAQKALTLGPPQARVHNLLGQAFHRTGRLVEALASFDRAIKLQPDFADAHGNRANVLADLGRAEEALAGYDRALSLRPDSPEDWCNRGAVLDELGRREEAIASYDRAIALRPDFAAAHFNRANVFKDLRRIEEALAGYQRAIELQPDFVEAHANRALALKFLDQYEAALASIDRALKLRPGDLNNMVNRGQILARLGRYEEAEAEYARVLAINPNLSALHLGRAIILLECGRFAEARAAAELACRLDPAAPEPAYALAYFQLLHGEWKEGWKNYESRNRTLKGAYYSLPYPRWQGEPLAGERLVAMTEQGMGDALHFCRFAPILAGMGFDVTLLTIPPLARLLSTLRGVRVATSTAELEQEKRPIRWVPLMSVPGILGVRPTTIPAQVPYLAAEPERVAYWADRLGTGGFKIGICWKSGPRFDRISRSRDVPLRAYAPLAEIPDVRLITLQLGSGLDEISQVSFRDRIENVSEGLRDWADTAALMMNVDLVVTCDTSVPHLAGALARPTFLALPSVACWRWQLEREDSPWYPTMRLFRQRAPDDWADVFARIAQAVRAMKDTPARAQPPASQ